MFHENSTAAGGVNTAGQNGAAVIEDDDNPFAVPNADEIAKQAQRQANGVPDPATEARCRKYGARRYDAAVLAVRDEGWAVGLRNGIARSNAVRDPLKAPPRLYFKGDEAVKAGASDRQIDALPALTDDEFAAMQKHAAVLHRDVQRQVNEDANALAAARRAADVALPERIDWRTWTPPDVLYVIDGLLAFGGVAGLFAEKKAGKTTAVVELVRAILRGDKFLGRFGVNMPDDAPVVLLDTEMGASSMNYEFSRAGIGSEQRDRLHYFDFTGRAAALDLRDEAQLARMAELIPHGGFIIIDCLYKVIAAAGLDEASSLVGGLLDGFKNLGIATGARGVLFAHHLGKDPDKGGRGHSSIEGMPDSLMRVTVRGQLGDDDCERSFSALGRLGVKVSPGRLTKHDDGRLTMSDGTAAAARRAETQKRDADLVWEFISEHPGMSRSAIEDAIAESGDGTFRGFPRGRVRAAVDALAETNRIVNDGTDKRPKWRAVEGVDPALMEMPDLSADAGTPARNGAEQ